MDLFTKLKKMRILLIDDDEWIRDSMTLFFESWGCSLLAFETAEEGLEVLKEESYNIIIADYRLPCMDGLAFFKKIRESSRHAIKILITAYGGKETVLSAKDIGVHDVIDKPFTTESIEMSLSRLLETNNR